MFRTSFSFFIKWYSVTHLKTFWPLTANLFPGTLKFCLNLMYSLNNHIIGSPFSCFFFAFSGHRPMASYGLVKRFYLLRHKPFSQHTILSLLARQHSAKAHREVYPIKIPHTVFILPVFLILIQNAQWYDKIPFKKVRLNVVMLHVNKF